METRLRRGRLGILAIADPDDGRCYILAARGARPAGTNGEKGLSAFADLLAEARRRRVFRTGGLYIVGAWALLQVADLALFTARRQGPSSSDILLPLLEAARPRRQANVVWVRAMIHAMTTERDREDRSTPVPMDTRGAPTIVLD